VTVRRRGWFEPGGYLLVAVLAVEVITGLAGHHNPDAQSRYGVPIFTVVLSCCLLSFLAVTARRCAVIGRVLTIGAGPGVAAAALWLAIVSAVPPIPASVGGTLVLITAAMVGAASATAGRRDSTEQGLLATLCAGTVATLLIFMLVGLLASYGPASLIPDNSGALTPAARLAQSRDEIVDSPLAVLVLGDLMAVVLSIASIATRRPTPADLDHAAATVR
jgi:hypothetical protein